MTRDELEQMRFAVDEDGNRKMATDLQYRKQVEALERKTYGTKPHREVVEGARRPAKAGRGE